MSQRREFLRALSAGGIAALGGLPSRVRFQEPLLTRRLPKGTESLPLVGLGSWITFNVGEDPVARNHCAEVMRAFFQAGGRVIDSSPMYGSAQAVIGHGLRTLGLPAALYSADKVWTGNGKAGPAQIEASRRAWGIPRFDLLQVHNLVAWREHLTTLLEMKAAGRVRHVGITTSEGRRHGEIEGIMRSQPIDFVQLTYNILDREAESRLLPLARDRGIAVIANRPFQQGVMIRRLERHRLPDWAGEIGCSTWAQFVLKFIISHPAVTCVIPATSNPAHARENLAAARGRLPDEAMRRRMAAQVEAL